MNEKMSVGLAMCAADERGSIKTFDIGAVVEKPGLEHFVDYRIDKGIGFDSKQTSDIDF